MPEPVLLVSHGADGVDLAEVRRQLTVAGSVAAAHLAAVVSVEQSADGGVVVACSPPGGPSLAALVASRGVLAVGEVVTLVAPLATTLATLHARGLELADVTAATVWLAADGRPVLMPVGIRWGPVDRGEVGRADVMALAAMALDLLDRASSGAALVTALQAAADGRLDAAGLGAAVLRSARAMPIGAATPARSPFSTRAVSSLRRRPALRAPAVLCAVVVVGIVLGGLLGRHDGGAVLAAPPPLPPPSASAASDESGAPSDRVPSWRAVMTTLERTRARAFATGDAALLSAVYAVGSPTGRADLHLLRELARDGQRAAGLQAFVERADVLVRSDTRVTLSVTDALTAYDVVDADGMVIRHGTGRPTRTWRATLVQVSGSWRIWSVGAASSPSPRSSTQP
jgi:hypothetical protein